MKRRLGVSLYPDNSDFNQDKDYLVLAKKIWVFAYFYEYVRG